MDLGQALNIGTDIKALGNAFQGRDIMSGYNPDQQPVGGGGGAAAAPAGLGGSPASFASGPQPAAQAQTPPPQVPASPGVDVQDPWAAGSAPAATAAPAEDNKAGKAIAGGFGTIGKEMMSRMGQGLQDYNTIFGHGAAPPPAIPMPKPGGASTATGITVNTPAAPTQIPQLPVPQLAPPPPMVSDRRAKMSIRPAVNPLRVFLDAMNGVRR